MKQVGTNILKRLLFAGAFALAAALGASGAQAIEIVVTPALAPNAFGSPNFPAWEANAVNALYTGQASGGAAGTPAFYQAQSNVTSREAVVTGFPSWLGQLDPGTTVGPAFAGEYGNRMTFGLSILGDGQQFSISQLSFDAHSNDPGDLLAFGFGAGDYEYGSGYLGVLYGADGQLGGGDDSFITSGANTQLVDALFARGSGNSNPAYCTGVCDAADQEAALAAAANIPGLTQFTGTYSLSGQYGDISGSGTFNIGVPEPSAWALMLAGFGGIGLAMRRRRGLAAA